jgi:hypothetical protein
MKIEGLKPFFNLYPTSDPTDKQSVTASSASLQYLHKMTQGVKLSLDSDSGLCRILQGQLDSRIQDRNKLSQPDRRQSRESYAVQTRQLRRPSFGLQISYSQLEPNLCQAICLKWL